MDELRPPFALPRAIAAAGSQAKLAKLVGRGQAAISKWLKKGHPLPAEHVFLVEAETGISRHDLRPDLFPRESSAELEGFVR